MGSSFARTYFKQILLVLAPLLFSPLLFLDELKVLDKTDLCDIYQIDEESCEATFARLTSNDPPCLFKVCFFVD